MTLAPSSVRRRAMTYSWYVVWALLAVSVLGYVDRLILSFLVEPIKKDLGLTDTQVGLLTGLAFAVLYAVAGLPLGRIMDRANRGLVLAACVVTWSVGTVCGGLAGSFSALFLARVAVGAGEAGLSPAAVSLIGDHFDPGEAEKPLGLFTVGLYVGGGAALIVGGELIAYLSSLRVVVLPIVGQISAWRAAFILIGVPGLALAALIGLTVRGPHRGAGRRSVASLGDTLAFARQNGKLLSLLILAVMAWGFNGYGLLNWYPAMLTRTYGLSARELAWAYGSVFLVGGALGALSLSPAVRWASRRGARNPLFAVAVWTMAAMTLSSIAGPLAPTAAGAIVCTFITLLTSSMTTASIYSIIVAVVPAQLRGTYTSAYMAVMNLTGGAFGALLVGMLTDHVFGPSRLNIALSTVASVFGPLSVVLIVLARGEYSRRPPLIGDAPLAMREVMADSASPAPK